MTEKRNRKQDILDAALACFNEAGIEATTVETIRARCGASIGSIYHHFGNKEGIVAELFICGMRDHAQSQTALLGRADSAEAGIKALVYAYVDWVVAHPELARFVFHARGAVAAGPRGVEHDQASRAHFARLFEWFEPHLRSGALRPLPPEIYPALIIGPAQEYCRAWLSGRAKTAPSEHRERFGDAAWRTVGNDGPRAG